MSGQRDLTGEERYGPNEGMRAAMEMAAGERGTAAGGRRWETFSFLPPLTAPQVAAQVAWILARGWVPAVEFTDAPGPRARYWTMWRLPFFGIEDPGRVLAEVEACASAHPEAWIRVVGHDRRRGGLATAFVVRRPGGGW
jgi:ribulose-bisphosphate carboxylase small chain